MPSNFFDLYHDYTKDSEPPPNYHAWCALAAIGALLGKKVSIPQGDFTIFPNYYIVLVGDPGARKSTAMSIAKRLVKMVPSVPVAPESATRESLIDDMASSRVQTTAVGRDVSYWQSSAFVGELEQFLGGKHINQGMVGFLTAIWDEMYFKERTRKGGEVIIHNPYFTMLGCCTTQWMNTKLKQDVITDGFSRRTIFVSEKESDVCNPWPVKTAEQIEQWSALTAEAKRIHKLAGKYIPSKGAYEYFVEIYIQTKKEMKDKSEKTQPYFSSRHILLLKVAMMITAGLGNSMIIGRDTMIVADKFLKESEKSLDEVFAGVGRNELKAYQERIYQRIVRSGEKGLDKSLIYQQSTTDLNSTEIEEALSVLTTTKMIKFATSSNAQDPTSIRYQASTVVVRAPAERLLELVRPLKPSLEVPMADLSIVGQLHHLDPATEKLLDRQQQRRLSTGSGLLLKGKQSQVPGEFDSLLDLPEQSPSPASPEPGPL